MKRKGVTMGRRRKNRKRENQSRSRFDWRETWKLCFLFLSSSYSWDVIDVSLLSVSLIAYRVLAKRTKESRLGC